MLTHQKSSYFALLACMLISLQGCSKSTPPPSEENSDPPMISMESAVPEEAPSTGFKLAISGIDTATAGKPSDLEIALNGPDGSAPKLKLIDTNFIIVSKDLKSFQRIKPVVVSPGKLKVTADFPTEGTYLSCLQFTTDGGKNYSISQPLQVGKAKTESATLTPDVGRSKDIDGYTFNLLEPPEYASEQFIDMPRFRISRDHRPSSDIEDLDKKAGYAILVKEGGDKFLRTMAVTNQSASKFYQQPIMFHVKVPEAGVYRMWAQVKIGGVVHLVDYTFAVKSPT